MSQRHITIGNIETAPPATAEQYLAVKLMSNQLTNNRVFLESHGRRGSSDMNKNVKMNTLPTEVLKIKSKIKDLCYNANGTRLFVVCRESLSIVVIPTMTLLTSLNVKCVRILAHPKDPNMFALLHMDGGDAAKPCIKVYSMPNLPGAALETRCTIHSAFDDIWYSGAWSLDGSTLAVVDRGDHLQHVNITDLKDVHLKEEDAISLSTEVYGMVYTKDALVIQKVDGRIEIFSLDFKTSELEQVHSNIVLSTAYNPETNLLATGGSDHVVNLISCADDYTCIGTYPGLEGKVGCMSFSTDGALLAWGTKDSLFQAHDNSYGGSDNSPEEEFYLTIAGTDCREIFIQQKMPTAVTHVQFCPDNYTLAYACDLDTLPKNLGMNHMIGVLRI